MRRGPHTIPTDRAPWSVRAMAMVHPARRCHYTAALVVTEFRRRLRRNPAITAS
jgi:hypothetical protein